MVTYRGKFNPSLGRDYQYVTPREFLAMLVFHILLRYETVIYYHGAVSTKFRVRLGWVSSEGSPPQPNSEDAREDGEGEFAWQRKKTWARLISKTWVENPEVCPKCGEKMKVIAAISSPSQDDLIEKILRSVGPWDPPWKRERKTRGPPARQVEISTEDGMFSEAAPFDYSPSMRTISIRLLPVTTGAFDGINRSSFHSGQSPHNTIPPRME